MELNKIYNESCLTTLRRMPDNFLDCVITSPPYYGLRAYQTEPQIWGDETCDHKWGETHANPKTDTRTPEEKQAQGSTVGSNVATLHWANGDMGQFCLRCNAWKGELGLEPTFQLYLDHLIEIFREVKRVLKPSGTVWVNLGDSYSGSNGNGYKQTVANKNASNGLDINQDFRKMYGKIDLVRPKSLMNIPHRFFIRMTDELGFIQRNNINWWKRTCMPSSAKDRFTVDFESIGFFTKEPKYYFEQQLEEYTKPLDRWAGENLVATQSEGWHTGTGQMIYRDRNMRPNPNGRNMRTTWDITFEPSGQEHYASYPTALVGRMVAAGCPESVCKKCGVPRQRIVQTKSTPTKREQYGEQPSGNGHQSSTGWVAPERTEMGFTDCGCGAGWEAGTVYDPFGGTATTAVTSHQLGRRWICSELQPKYVDISERRLEPVISQGGLF